MYDQRSKVLKAKLKFGVVPAILLVIPLIGNAILSTYLVSLSRLLGSQRIMEKARLCIGAINGMFLALVLTIWLGVNTSLEAALIFFVATFLMIYVIFRILMGFLLVDLGTFLKVDAIRYAGYLFPFLPLLGPLSLSGVVLLVIGFHEASESKILIKNKKF